MSEWTGDLADDCLLYRYGMTAHVECMDRGHWWFAVYSGKGEIGCDDLFNTANQQTHIRLTSGKMARAAAAHRSARTTGHLISGTQASPSS